MDPRISCWLRTTFQSLTCTSKPGSAVEQTVLYGAGTQHVCQQTLSSPDYCSTHSRNVTEAAEHPRGRPWPQVLSDARLFQSKHLRHICLSKGISTEDPADITPMLKASRSSQALQGRHPILHIAGHIQQGVYPEHSSASGVPGNHLIHEAKEALVGVRAASEAVLVGAQHEGSPCLYGPGLVGSHLQPTWVTASCTDGGCWSPMTAACPSGAASVPVLQQWLPCMCKDMQQS